MGTTAMTMVEVIMMMMSIRQEPLVGHLATPTVLQGTPIMMIMKRRRRMTLKLVILVKKKRREVRTVVQLPLMDKNSVIV